jgi:predicted  nucleic acid-binding Zn-ribbon protein
MTRRTAFDDLEANIATLRADLDRLRTDFTDLHWEKHPTEKTLLEEAEQSYSKTLANLERVRLQALADSDELPEDLRASWHELRHAFQRLVEHRSRAT